MRYGYKASAEQFGPRQLLNLSAQAEALGLDTVAISDHFQPWRHHGGHSPAALPWLGAAGERLPAAFLRPSGLTPTPPLPPGPTAAAPPPPRSHGSGPPASGSRPPSSARAC